MDDVVIVGGGIIGAATAYFLSKEGRRVKVIERDPTYKTASFPLSLGGFRRQFFQTENILLGKFAREFIFQIPELPKTVFSSIDQMGRYAYCNQPIITKWNLSRLAECLIPLIDDNQNKAIELATKVINSFEKKYEDKWLEMMRQKIGLFGDEEKDKFLILDLLTWMHKKKVDYTNTFCHLMNEENIKDNVYDDVELKEWKKRWEKRLLINSSLEKCIKLMRSVNPLIIPRNHKVEESLKEANQNNFKPLNNLIKVLEKPYNDQNEIQEYQHPKISKEKYQTFCGT